MLSAACRKRTVGDDALALHTGIAATCSTNKGVCDGVTALYKHGWLSHRAEAVLAATITATGLRTSLKDTASASPPYGTMIQSMSLGGGLLFLDYIHPMALLHHWSAHSRPFFDLMNSSCGGGAGFKLIRYVDDICPGNPLLPEEGLTFQAVCWAIDRWPERILQRCGA